VHFHQAKILGHKRYFIRVMKVAAFTHSLPTTEPELYFLQGDTVPHMLELKFGRSFRYMKCK
jgi:hypothetical protein